MQCDQRQSDAVPQMRLHSSRAFQPSAANPSYVGICLEKACAHLSCLSSELNASALHTLLQADPRQWTYSAVPTSPTSPAAPAVVDARAGDVPVQIPLLGAR